MNSPPEPSPLTGTQVHVCVPAPSEKVHSVQNCVVRSQKFEGAQAPGAGGGGSAVDGVDEAPELDVLLDVLPPEAPELAASTAAASSGASGGSTSSSTSSSGASSTPSTADPPPPAPGACAPSNFCDLTTQFCTECTFSDGAGTHTCTCVPVSGEGSGGEFICDQLTACQVQGAVPASGN